MAKTKLTPEEVEAFQKLNEEALAFRSGGKGRGVSIVVGLIFLLVLGFFWVPALNGHDPALYKTLAVALAVYCLMRVATSGFYKPSRNIIQTVRFLFREEKIALLGLLAVLLVWGGGMAVSSPFFFSRQYHELLEVSAGNFTDDVDAISYDKIPMTDEQSAVQLGSRALGELSDLVSQFEVSGSYAQINLNGSPVRIAALRYGNLFKWLANRGGGLPGYVAVNMMTQDAAVVRTEQGILYSDSEPLLRNIGRYLRLNYPTYIFGKAHLEIDESGQPWWICPREVKTIGLFGGTDVVGAALVHAGTGETVYYELEDIPQWVDQLFDPELIQKQYDWYGKYGGGFWNSVLSQSGVTTTTEGVNFIAIEDDVYLYTGITSSGNDQSNVGFILCNQRTKETRYYAISGATEQSAQRSAEGAVQHLGYTATFPLLLNISNEPTYFVALKDSANLAKRYAMVNVEQYQLVAVGSTLEECENNYVALLKEQGISMDQPAEPTVETEISGTIDKILENVINGTTHYYIKLFDMESYLMISAEVCPYAVILQPGDVITLRASSHEIDGFFCINTISEISINGKKQG